MFLLTFVFAAAAGPNECRDAIERYNSAVDEISSRLRRYARCVSDSQGLDDCSSEFRRLRSAHADFESAVSDHQRECRRQVLAPGFFVQNLRLHKNPGC